MMLLTGYFTRVVNTKNPFGIQVPEKELAAHGRGAQFRRLDSR